MGDYCGWNVGEDCSSNELKYVLFYLGEGLET